MRIWSILVIKSDLKWCIHLSRSLFLYLCNKVPAYFASGTWRFSQNYRMSPELLVCLQVVVQIHPSIPMQCQLSLNICRNNLEQICITCVHFNLHDFETCFKCPYRFLLWQFNDNWHCIDTEWCICTTICKHTRNSGLSWFASIHAILDSLHLRKIMR